jgi:hypothetical protein
MAMAFSNYGLALRKDSSLTFWRKANRGGFPTDCLRLAGDWFYREHALPVDDGRASYASVARVIETIERPQTSRDH